MPARQQQVGNMTINKIEGQDGVWRALGRRHERERQRGGKSLDGGGGGGGYITTTTTTKDATWQYDNKTSS